MAFSQHHCSATVVVVLHRDCLITLQGPPSYLSKRIAERGLAINHDVLKKLHGIDLWNSAKWSGCKMRGFDGRNERRWSYEPPLTPPQVNLAIFMGTSHSWAGHMAWQSGSSISVCLAKFIFFKARFTFASGVVD